jgi:hypothetical protein
MSIAKQGTEFLNQLIRDDNAAFMESVASGFRACFESESNPISIDASKVTMTERGTYSDGMVEESDYLYNGGEQIVALAKASEGMSDALRQTIEHLNENNVEIDSSKFGISISTPIEVDGRFFGSYYSASSTGPAEEPEFEINRISAVFDDSSVGFIYYNNEDMFDFMIESDLERSIASAIIDAADIESSLDDAEIEKPPAPSGFTTTYSGPM